MSSKKTITHIDLFAGPGGVATGFGSIGIKTLLANEYIESVRQTYTANHPETIMMSEDIRDISDKRIKKELTKLGFKNVDIVSAGFPCETFSTAGATSRASYDHRNTLYKEAIRIANAAKAKILMLENVPAFLTKKIEKGSDIRIYDMLVKDLEDAGFKHHNYKILNASEHGVPQIRKRFLMLASKTIDVGKMEIKGNGKIVSVNQALSDLPPIEDNTQSDKYLGEPGNEYQQLMRDLKQWGTNEKLDIGKLTYHVTPKHRAGTKKRFELVMQGEGLKDIFDKHTAKEIAKLQAEKILPKKWYIQRNYRLIANKPSKTVTSHCLDELIHPNLNRGLSVREVARLQSFPDWYNFIGGPFVTPHNSKIQDKYEQIGDAVPPLLAKAVGKYIIKLLSA